MQRSRRVRTTTVIVTERSAAQGECRPGCCPHYHEAIELIGKRWSGAILAVMIDGQRPLRFSEVAAAIPQLSDRLLTERLRELESRGLIARREYVGAPPRVEYELTEMGRALDGALEELARWARSWMA